MLWLPSLDPDEAAPSQRSDEESVVQVRIGPSLCLAESGWKVTCKGKTGRDGGAQLLRADKGGFSLDRKSSKKSVST
jgi:hypothetical protein